MRQLSRSALSLFVSLSVCGLSGCAGCGGKSKEDTTKLMKSEDAALPKVDPTLCETEGKRIVTSDLDHDRRPDVWNLYMTTQEGDTTVEYLSCRQTDYDHDGRKDHVIAFTQKGGTAFQKFDFDFDGRFDAFFQYDPKTGKLFEIQRETGFDGRYDIQEMYDENEVIKSIRHDRNGDGEPDMWEQYVAGDLVAILYDDDYDSKVDRREESKVAQPKKPTPGNDVASGDAPAAGASGEAAGDDTGDGTDKGTGDKGTGGGDSKEPDKGTKTKPAGESKPK